MPLKKHVRVYTNPNMNGLHVRTYYVNHPISQADVYEFNGEPLTFTQELELTKTAGLTASQLISSLAHENGIRRITLYPYRLTVEIEPSARWDYPGGIQPKVVAALNTVLYEHGGIYFSKSLPKSRHRGSRKPGV